jgi:hypothetical protein
VTSQVVVPVGPNYAPTISAKYVSPVAVGLPYQFNVTADDSNAPDKTRWRFTWDWGDGSPLDVTTSPTAWHTYGFKKTYDYTVSVNDMSLLPNHNVSATNSIRVASPSNVAPEINPGTFMVSPLAIVQGDSIDMQVDVRDWDQDPLYVDFELYIGTDLYDVEEVITPSKKTAWTTVTASYVFDLEAPIETFSVWLNVSDGQEWLYDGTIYDVVVSLGNKPPTVALLPLLNLTKGSAHTFDVVWSDINGDPCTFWWDFGDGNYSALEHPSKAYATSTTSQQYSVSVNDGTGLAGHNVTRVGYAAVNTKPVIDFFPPQSLLGGESGTVTVIGSDEDDMTVNFVWNWGDGTPWDTTVGIPEAEHTYPVPAGSSQNYTVTLYMNDLYVDADGVSHNVSKTTTVTVGPAKFTKSITAGWNFIVVPLVGAGYKASMLGLEKNDIVAQWNPASKSYDKTYIVGVSPGPLDFVLAPSSGYWVFADSNETVDWVGASPTGMTFSRTVTTPAGGGWVNIGLHTTSTTWKASKFLTMWSGSNFSLVAMYNPATKQYKTYIKNVIPSDYYLVPGWAIWILVDGSGTLTYTA